MPQDKSASRIVIYLIEELGDARLRAAQLQRYVTQATDLIEKSEHRDHFFEVAAHLIHGIPQTLFKMSKALDASALAAARLDYEEIKQGLKPEKADELEDVMEDARLRYLNRRSNEEPMTPKLASEILDRLAAKTRVTGKVPVTPLLQLIASLEGPAGRTASDNDAMAQRAEECFREASKAVLTPGQEPSRLALASLLRRVLADAMQPTSQAMQAAIFAQATSRQDVIDGFMAANPAMSKEDAEKAADEWEKNKDVVKDKTAASLDPAAVNAFRDVLLPLVWPNLLRTVATSSGDMLDKLHAAERDHMQGQVGTALMGYKPERSSEHNFIEDIESAIANWYKTAKNHLAAEFMPRTAMSKTAMTLDEVRTLKDQLVEDMRLAGAGEAFQKANPAITDEQAAKIDEMHAKHKDNFKSANLGETRKIYEVLAGAFSEGMEKGGIDQNDLDSAADDLVRTTKEVAAMRWQTTSMLGKLPQGSLNRLATSIYWLANFMGGAADQGSKTASEDKTADSSVVIERQRDNIERQLKEFDHSWGLYKAGPQRYKPQLDNVAAAFRSIGTSARVALGLIDPLTKHASEETAEDKESKHEKGKEMDLEDVTKDMSEEDKAKFKKMNDEHGDKFKTAMAQFMDKTGRLMSRQEAILKKYVQSGGKSMFFDELPADVQKDLSRVKDQETLPSDVDRWLSDNNNPHLRAASEPENKDSYDKRVEKDPTVNMSPEDAAEWKKQHEEHKDEFKTAAKVVPLAEAKKGDMVEVTYKGKKFTGKVVRVKKDGVITVDPMNDDINEGAWIDFNPPKKTASYGRTAEKSDEKGSGEWVVYFETDSPKTFHKWHHKSQKDAIADAVKAQKENGGFVTVLKGGHEVVEVAPGGKVTKHASTDESYGR